MFKVTDRFDIGAGLRYTETSEDRCQVITGTFGNGILTCSIRPMQSVPTQ